MRLQMISRWSSPIPLMTICPVCSSVLALKVGSSRTSFAIVLVSLSRSPPDLGSIAIEMTVSGNCIAS